MAHRRGDGEGRRRGEIGGIANVGAVVVAVEISCAKEQWQPTNLAAGSIGGLEMMVAKATSELWPSDSLVSVVSKKVG